MKREIDRKGIVAIMDMTLIECAPQPDAPGRSTMIHFFQRPIGHIVRESVTRERAFSLV
jgi:hypothetical protein